MTTMLSLVEAGLGMAALPALASPGQPGPALTSPGKVHPLPVSVPLDGPVVTRYMGLLRRLRPQRPRCGRTLGSAGQHLHDFFPRWRSRGVQAHVRKNPECAH